MENGWTEKEGGPQEAHGGNLHTLRQAPGPLLALVLLGACELLLIDASANYIVIYSIGGSGLFLVASFLLGLFSVGVLFWAVMKILRGQAGERRPEEGAQAAGGRGGLAGGMRAGAVLGAYASLAVCALVAASALAGAGVEKLMPEPEAGQGIAGRAFSYLLLFLIIMLGYTLAGAAAGAAAWFFGRQSQKSAEKKS